MMKKSGNRVVNVFNFCTLKIIKMVKFMLCIFYYLVYILI